MTILINYFCNGIERYKSKFADNMDNTGNHKIVAAGHKLERIEHFLNDLKLETRSPEIRG